MQCELIEKDSFMELPADLHTEIDTTWHNLARLCKGELEISPVALPSKKRIKVSRPAYALMRMMECSAYFINDSQIDWAYMTDENTTMGRR